MLRHFAAAFCRLPLPLPAGVTSAQIPAGGVHPFETPGGLSHLFLRRNARRKRATSTDPTGGNADGYPLKAGETKDIALLKGAGCIRHIFLTLHSLEEHYLRKCVLRARWDGESSPSIEVPIGDFSASDTPPSPTFGPSR